MGWRWLALAALAVFAAPSRAATVVSIRLPEAAAPGTAEKLKKTEAVLERLLADGALPAQGPFIGVGARYIRLSPAGMRPGMGRTETDGLVEGLRGLWGEDFELEELADRPQEERRPRIGGKEHGERIAARLDVGLSRERQDLFYDGGLNRAGAGSVVAAANPPVRSAQAPAAAAAMKAAPAPPPPAGAKQPEGVRWGRVGLEVLKGAGETVRSVFTWRGLATAAAAVAIVTVAPVAVYGFLAVGAAVGGYTIGKAIYDGVKAHRGGDAEGVYAASREFGKGALTLGLSLYGARHTPASLRPHFPKPGEYRALLSSMDDEAVVAATLFDKLRGK
ncbi:MAG: hypothetical protein HY928_07195 [Elusimicrobia bacterium]|nr:hypothetical protein [Elusimicrobiota bacterium]